MNATVDELEAAALALIAVEECGGNPDEAIAELEVEREQLDPDERALVERAQQIIAQKAAD